MPIENKKEEALLQSLDGIAKVAAPDFFYTRLRARMERETGSVQPAIFILKPAFLIGCMVLICLLNIITLAEKNKPASAPGNNAAGIESFAKEYDLSGNSRLYE